MAQLSAQRIILKNLLWTIILAIILFVVFFVNNKVFDTICTMETSKCGVSNGFGLTRPLSNWVGLYASIIVAVVLVPGIPLFLNKRAQKKIDSESPE
jgi:hypothetical protein